VFTLSGLNALAALSIDMSLPAQPTLATAFHVSAETAALNLSLFMLAFAFAQVFVGYLSDAIGRRPVMVAGLVVFTVAAVACSLSPTIEVLLVCRALQGAGSAACTVVSRAMVRDTQPAAQAARLLSTMLAVFAIAPMTGAFMLTFTHASLNETLPPERRTVATFAGFVRGYRMFFSTRGTRLPILISCASFAGLFAYVAGSPFVLMQGYGVAAEHYGLYFALTAIAIMFGSITGGRMLRAGRSPGVMILIGASIQLVAGAIVVACAAFDLFGLAGFVGPICLYFFGSGIAGPSATALAMEPLPQLAGTASSAVGSLTMISGSISGYWTTRIGGSTALVFAIVIGTMSAVVFLLAALAAYLRRQKQQESR